MTFLIIYCELVNIIKCGSYECDDEEVDASVIEMQRLLKCLHAVGAPEQGREAVQVISDVILFYGRERDPLAIFSAMTFSSISKSAIL